MLFAKNTDFRFIGEIGFSIQNLVASLRQFETTASVALDDPDGFSIHVHKGSIVVSPAQLRASLNQHVFDIPQAVVSKINGCSCVGRDDSGGAAPDLWRQPDFKFRPPADAPDSYVLSQAGDVKLYDIVQAI